jgi:hypothetical protein
MQAVGLHYRVFFYVRMMTQVESIMTLLQKIYVVLAGILFVLAVGGTALLAVYVYDECTSVSVSVGASADANTCTSLKVVLGILSVALALSCAYIIRVAYRIYKERNRPRTFNYYDPLLGQEQDQERIYAV